MARTHSKWYARAKSNYRSGRWDDWMLGQALAAGRITQEEHDEIAGAMEEPADSE